MPSKIEGLRGSCLVIPCSFNYNWDAPRNPDRVVWYQYHSIKYPLVYDSWYPQSVIDIFRGKTSKAYVSRHNRECSLKIYPVTHSDHNQKIYPWVDPEHVGSGTYRFFDKTVTIQVLGKLWWVHKSKCFRFTVCCCLINIFTFLSLAKGTIYHHLWGQESWTERESTVHCSSHLSDQPADSEAQHANKEKWFIPRMGVWWHIYNYLDGHYANRERPPNCGMLCSTFWWFNCKSLQSLECKMYVTYVQVKSFSICWPSNCNYRYPRPIFAFGYQLPKWISWRTANRGDLHSVIHMPTRSADCQMELWQHESLKSYYQGWRNTV